MEDAGNVKAQDHLCKVHGPNQASYILCGFSSKAKA